MCQVLISCRLNDLMTISGSTGNAANGSQDRDDEDDDDEDA